jgi:hypothetical protein
MPQPSSVVTLDYRQSGINIEKETLIMNEDKQSQSVTFEEFSAGEDEFDIDLMACGCRFAPEANMRLSVYDIVRLYNLDFDKLVSLVGGLIDETQIDSRKLFEIAEKVSRNEVKEIDDRLMMPRP